MKLGQCFFWLRIHSPDGAQRAKRKRVTFSSPLIISLALDSASFEIVNDLRTRHFPPERLKVGAHVTLFHALPGEEEPLVRETLDELCARTKPLSLRFSSLRFLGRGVAVDVECAELIPLRGELARVFRSHLTAQDAQGWKHPHVTIQNKVTPDVARATFNQLNEAWKPFDGVGEGLRLWRYRGGFWEDAGLFGFKMEK